MNDFTKQHLHVLFMKLSLCICKSLSRLFL